MIVSFSKDYGTLTVNVDEANREQDMANCQKLEKLFESEAWLILLELLAQGESKFDEAVMKVKPQEQSFREVAIHASRKNGFCEAMKMLGKAVNAYRLYRIEQKEVIGRQVDEILGKEEEVIYGAG